MNPRSHLTSLAVASLLLSGCAGLTASHLPTFEGPALNRAWYGAYDRPLPAVTSEELAAAEERRRERDAAAAARRDERDAVSDERQRQREAAALAAAEERRAREALATAREQTGATPPASTSRPSAPAPTSPPPAVPASSARPALPEAPADATYNPLLAAAYLRAVYAENETPAGDDSDGVVELYRYAQEHGTIYHSTPAVGDLVFFHNTYDADTNGRNNDWYTHAGLVEDVATDGTISVLSYVDGRVVRTFMNLADPGSETLNGRTVNSVMRRRSNRDPEYTLYLAGELFAGFAGLLGNREEVVVLDSWQPPSSMVAATR